MEGVWDGGGGLEVEFVGLDMTDEMIKGVVAENRDANAFTHTVDRDSEAQAFQAVSEALGADRVRDCRGPKAKLMWEQPEPEDDA